MPVRAWRFHPAGTHKSPIPAARPAVEAVTDRGSRWYGCDNAYINAELRFVVVGCDAPRDDPRAWPIVRAGLRVPQGAPELDAFTRAYIDCALWSSTDNGYLGEGHPDNDPDGANTGGNPLDAHFDADDLASEARATCAEDCAAFRAYCAAQGVNLDGLDDEQAGHDFWLTRNGHGAGFWDRGLDRLGDDLTRAAKTFGSCNLYVGDDGKVHVS